MAETLTRVIQRADELSEFVAIYWAVGRQPLSAQVKKGLAAAFAKFDEYALAKYDRAGAVRLRDVLFLSHARPVDEAQAALWKRLAENELATPDTWEVALSAAGRGEGAEKKAVWERLLTEHKLGALALLRNLRNLHTAGVEDQRVIEALAALKTDRVLPFRFLAAARNAPQWEEALEQAMFRALEGRSGEARGPHRAAGGRLRVDGVDHLRPFGDAPHRRCVRSGDSAAGDRGEGDRFSLLGGGQAGAARRGMALRDALDQSQSHAGTYLGAALEQVEAEVREGYDRLVVITDEQSHDQVPAPVGQGYVINVASARNGVGYGEWTHIDGWSEAVVDYIAELEAARGDPTRLQAYTNQRMAASNLRPCRLCILRTDRHPECSISRSNSHNVCKIFAWLHYSVHSSARPPAIRSNGRRARADRLSQTIFVLEDDADISRLVQHHLEAAGFQPRLFHTPTNLIPDAERQAPALFLLDIMVPGGDGLDVCRRLRNHPALSTIPIIFLTARAGENDRVLGLELGADDYITKPFATRELVARVKAVLRRFERPTTPSVISFEEVIIDANAMQLSVRGELTTTTATEFRLLDYLARHPGRVFSRDHLLDAVWGDARFVTPRSVDVYVRRIREKIEVDPENPRYLKTVRGAGYRFETSQGRIESKKSEKPIRTRSERRSLLRPVAGISRIGAAPIDAQNLHQAAGTVYPAAGLPRPR